MDKLDTATLAALIASCTSVLVTIISVISAFISSRHSSKLAKDIEKLKHNLSLERQAIDEKKKVDSEQLTALTESIKAIQKVKDVIQRIVGSYENSHFSEVAIKNIKNASNELSTCYEERFTDLVIGRHPDEKKLFHRAKGLAFNIEDYLISSLAHKEYVSDLSNEERKRLLAWRTEISEIQTQLQNSLYELFIEFNLNRIPA